jgi:hypothetical protein
MNLGNYCAVRPFAFLRVYLVKKADTQFHIVFLLILLRKFLANDR